MRTHGHAREARGDVCTLLRPRSNSCGELSKHEGGQMLGQILVVKRGLKSTSLIKIDYPTMSMSAEPSG
eukprot:1220210-Prymnesium_polylepis.1